MFLSHEWIFPVREETSRQARIASGLSFSFMLNWRSATGVLSVARVMFAKASLVLEGQFDSVLAYHFNTLL